MNLGDVWRPKAKIRLGLLDLLVYPLLHTNYEKSTGTSRCSPKNQVYDVVIFFYGKSFDQSKIVFYILTWKFFVHKIENILPYY